MWVTFWKTKTLDKVVFEVYCTESVYQKPLMPLTNQHALAVLLLKELCRRYPQIVRQALESEAGAKDLTLSALRQARALFPANLERYIAAPIKCPK